jgi:hypothetical protein
MTPNSLKSRTPEAGVTPLAPPSENLGPIDVDSLASRIPEDKLGEFIDRLFALPDAKKKNENQQ